MSFALPTLKKGLFGFKVTDDTVVWVPTPGFKVLRWTKKSGSGSYPVPIVKREERGP